MKGSSGRGDGAMSRRSAVNGGPRKELISGSTRRGSRPIVQQNVGQLPTGYDEFVKRLKVRIQAARVRASLAANHELILLYWDIGRRILEQQAAQGWGAKVVERLARDLRIAFPDMKGLSPRNLMYMRSFAEAYSEDPIVQRVVAQLPWGHNVDLIDKVKDQATRLWYAHQAIAHGWSRNILALQIESGLHKRQGRAVTNFKDTLVPPQSELAQQVLKDPYVFDFLTIAEGAKERDVERDLVSHITHFLLELGAGFSFVGRQVHLEVGGEDSYIDLLFYHLRLRCFVVIDLKAQPFQPEFAGKMNFYLSAVDDLLRHPDDKPSIGLVLCREKNRITAEYALRDIRKPIGVAGWRTKITESLPRHLRGSLPTIAEIEAELRTKDTP